MEQEALTSRPGDGDTGGQPGVVEAAWYAIAIAVVLALGLVNLFYPFGDDQAVLFFAARELEKGAVLYQDYWGNKQPGLYAFYYLACRLFGFTEQGVHTLELLWMLVFAAVLMRTLRPYLYAGWLSSLAPVATIGIYYATAREDELTQLEMLVALPLYLVAWCSLQALKTRTGAKDEAKADPKRMAALFFASGLAAAIATLFKLLLAPIPVAFWIIASSYLIRERRITLPGLIGVLWLPVAAGVILPFAAVVLWFWQAGALQELLWTAFIYPPEAYMTSPPASPGRLIFSGIFALANFTPWLLFLAVAVVAWWRAPRAPMGTMLLIWLFLAGVLFLVQRFSWWPYHTLLAFTPVGILAVLGLDHIARFLYLKAGEIPGWLWRKVTPAMLCTLLLAVPLTASLAGPFLAKAKPMFTADNRMVGDRLLAYQWKVHPAYKKIWKSSSFLRGADAMPGPIYSFGSALVYAFTGRESAHKTAGFSWEFYVPSQIAEILAALEAKKAPYIFVENDRYRLFKQQPSVKRYITSNYIQIDKDDAGIWYERLP